MTISTEIDYTLKIFTALPFLSTNYTENDCLYGIIAFPTKNLCTVLIGPSNGKKDMIIGAVDSTTLPELDVSSYMLVKWQGEAPRFTIINNGATHSPSNVYIHYSSSMVLSQFPLMDRYRNDTIAYMNESLLHIPVNSDGTMNIRHCLCSYDIKDTNSTLSSLNVLHRSYRRPNAYVPYEKSILSLLSQLIQVLHMISFNKGTKHLLFLCILSTKLIVTQQLIVFAHLLGTTVDRWNGKETVKIAGNSYNRRQYSYVAKSRLLTLVADQILGFLVFNGMVRVAPVILVYFFRFPPAYYRRAFELIRASDVTFKLNLPLSDSLERCFTAINYLYTSVAWINIDQLQGIAPFTVIPLLRLTRYAGLTVQLGLLVDLLRIASLLPTFLFAFISALVTPFKSSIISLFLLFYGKKRNMLRDRIDSISYSFDQLLIGSLLLPIGLLLFPTVLVYYVVLLLPCLGLVFIRSLITNFVVRSYFIDWVGFYTEPHKIHDMTFEFDKCWNFKVQKIHYLSIKVAVQGKQDLPSRVSYGAYVFLYKLPLEAVKYILYSPNRGGGNNIMALIRMNWIEILKLNMELRTAKLPQVAYSLVQ